VVIVDNGKTLVSDGDGQRISVRMQTQQPNLLDDLNEREHGTPCARSPMLPVRHIVSDDVDLISQSGDLCEEFSRMFGILPVSTQLNAHITSNIAPDIAYSALQSAPHRR
jgi:hypothetical protein